ncbi:hypothetical protein D3C76_472900 [compost metagenome]
MSRLIRDFIATIKLIFLSNRNLYYQKYNSNYYDKSIINPDQMTLHSIPACLYLEKRNVPTAYPAEGAFPFLFNHYIEIFYITSLTSQ